MKIGFVGTGAISEAIVLGLLKAEFRADDIIVSPRSHAVSKRLSEKSSRVRIGNDNQDVVDNADVILLAVLPQDAEKVVEALNFKAGQTVISLIATVPIASFEKWIKSNVEICRAVPLPFVAHLNGVTVVFPEAEKASAIFLALGSVVNCATIDEFDAFTAGGAIMAAYFQFGEVAAQWLVGQGVAYEKARDYLVPFFFGLADNAMRSPGKSFVALRQGHITPGGINEQVYLHFDTKGGSDALRGGLDSVAARLRAAGRT